MFSRINRGRPLVTRVITNVFYGSNSIRKGRSDHMTIINKIALAVAIIGTLNWGLVGLFRFDAATIVGRRGFDVVPRLHVFMRQRLQDGRGLTSSPVSSV